MNESGKILSQDNMHTDCVQFKKKMTSFLLTSVSEECSDYSYLKKLSRTVHK